MGRFLVFLLWAIGTVFLAGCAGEQTHARHEAMLDSAKVEMLQNMDYRKAEGFYLSVIGETRNKLLRLLADVGMMKLCQIESRSKDFYEYRSDALRLMEELRTAQGRMDERNDSIWEAAKGEFNLVSAVYYYNLRDFERAREVLGISREEMADKEVFFAQYVGKESLYFLSMKKKWQAEKLTDAGGTKRLWTHWRWHCIM